MNIRSIIEFLEEMAPPHLQESYDNSGLIIGNLDAEISGALICLDITEEIIDEAIEKGFNLIIAHHPIIFHGLKTITGKNYVERVVIKAIRSGIALYAIHTNLDNVLREGVNGEIASRLELINIEVLRPIEGESDGIGGGVIGFLSNSMTASKFLSFLSKKIDTKCIRHTALLDKPIQKIAVIGGSGSFMLQDAIKHNADVFITGDFKYHEFFDAENRIIIADIGHFESEQYTIDLLYRKLSEKFSNFALAKTSINTNPINYYYGSKD